MADFNKNDYPFVITLVVEGMACEHCVMRVNKAFEKLGFPVEVDLNSKRVTVYTKEQIAVETLEATVNKLGFEAKAI